MIGQGYSTGRKMDARDRGSLHVPAQAANTRCGDLSEHEREQHHMMVRQL